MWKSSVQYQISLGDKEVVLWLLCANKKFFVLVWVQQIHSSVQLQMGCFDFFFLSRSQPEGGSKSISPMFESMTNVKLNQTTYFQKTVAVFSHARPHTHTHTHTDIEKIHFIHHLRAQSLSIQSKARQLVRIQCGKVLSKRDWKHVDRQQGLAENILDCHKSCGHKVPQGLFNVYQKKKKHSREQQIWHTTSRIYSHGKPMEGSSIFRSIWGLDHVF